MTNQKRFNYLAKGVSTAALGAAMGLFIAGSAMAQTQTGALRVAVTGNDGQPLSGATVVVSSPDSLITRSGVTDATGRVRVAGLDPAQNYTVEIAAPGYAEYSASNVAVVTGRDLSVGYVLAGASSDATSLDDIIVTGRALAAIDVTSATVSTTLTLAVVEALPTGRDYQSYLQLVPGVKPSQSGNPASRSGVNYSDIGGVVGSSSDNVYFLDGVDVTDPVDGLFGANFNSEIIQEQQVLVGGIPAEYAGGSGLVSRVVTKSGSNEWHGSLNYYFQNDSLVAEDKHDTSGGFSTYDTAFTLGGPILRDRLWLYGSYQKKYREDEVLDPTTGDIRRTVEDEAEYGFAKLTWQITDNDRLTATFFNDPRETTGSRVSTVLNRRDRAVTTGGDNYKIDYSRTWGDLIFNAYYFKHEGEYSAAAADQSIRDNVSYLSSANADIELRQLGGYGANFTENRDREEYGVNAEYFLDTSFGSHTFKAGYSSTENIYSQVDSIPGDVTYNSIAGIYSGTTFAEYVAPGWTSRSFTDVDIDRIAGFIEGNATALASVDTDADGSVSAAELNALTFTDRAGNPYNNVNVYRTLRAVNAPYSVKSEGQTLYIQDTWTLDRFTVNAGLRAEKWEHFASDGSKVATFDWDIAPRFSAVFDVFGDGRSKVFGFAGRYYDPVRNNMSDFAGSLTGPVSNEQINVNGEWVTFRVRGGASTPDALFAPSTKTPYTDEFMFGASTTFGNSIGLSASVTHRVTKNILEDYDLGLYSDPTCTVATCGGDGKASPGTAFYLPYSYFGYDSKPNSNYVIGTLAGGKREYTGYEITLTKFKTDNWMGQASYTYNDAQGNTNSDSNADYQGDWIALDPRAPNVWGDQPGNIKHQFKAYGSYDFDFGLQVSGVLNWNSGSLYTPAEIVASRYFAPMSGGYEFGGVTDSYLLPGFVGSEEGPSYYTFDMRFKYVRDLPIGEAEFFLDVFNVFDKQSAVSVMPVLAGNGIYDYQEATDWVEPRRAYLGVRYSF